MEDKRTQGIKEKIVEEAIRLMVRKSFKGTSIQDITDAVRVTKGAFYWHFKSKDALLDTILDDFERMNTDRIITESNRTSGDFVQKYKYFHKFLTEFAFQNRDLCVGFMTLSAELTGSGTGHEQKIKAIHAKLHAFLKDLIEQGKREGRVRQETDSDMAAHFLSAINNGILLEWTLYRNEIDGAALARAYRQITIQGITVG